MSKILISLKKILKHLVFFLFYGIIYIFFDLLLHHFIKNDNYNIVHIVLFDLFVSLLFAYFLSIKNNIIRFIIYLFTSTITIVYSLLVISEIFIFNSFETTYPIKTIISNFSNVFSDYTEDILSIVSNRISMIVFYILLIFLVIICSYIIYIKKNINLDFFYRIKFVFVGIILFVLSLFSIKNIYYNWENDIVENGIKIAIISNIYENNNYNLVINDNENDAIVSTYSEIVEELNIEDEYNILNFDFNEMINNEENSNFNDISKYLKNKEPTKKNKYTGLFKNKNLIMICAEAWNSNIVTKEAFPTTYRLIHNGFRFTNFYQPHGSSSTSSGEYAFLTGMVPVNNDRSFSESINNNMGFCIPKILKNQNYNTFSFHNGRAVFYNRDETHDSLIGVDKYIANDTGLRELANKNYISDKDLFNVTFDLYKDKQPFYCYYMTYTGHMPYHGSISNDIEIEKIKLQKLYDDKYSDILLNYMAKNMILEKGLTILINKLEENDLLDDTVICMVPDHYPYGLLESSKKNNKNIDIYEELYNDPDINKNFMDKDKTEIVLWSGCLENELKDYVISTDKYCCSIDITPTLLNLFGLDYDSRIYPGRDILSDAPGFVIYQDGKFISDNYINKSTNLLYCDADDDTKYYVNNILNYCKFNLKNDYYGYLVGEKGKSNKICYLTFEGGPNDNTLQILNILEQYKVHSTFFVVGDQKLNYLKDINKKGHVIGIMSDFSDYQVLYSSKDMFVYSLSSIYNKVKTAMNKDVRLMRFPGGYKSKFGLNEKYMNELASEVKKFRLLYFDWNVDSNNEYCINEKQIVDNVMNNLNNKNIICIRFDESKNSYLLLKALPTIIEELRNKNYKFKTLSTYSYRFY